MAFNKTGKGQSLGVVKVSTEDKTADAQEVEVKTKKPEQPQAVNK